VGEEAAMDQYKSDALRHNTFEPRPSLRELNEQWVVRNRNSGPRDREQRRLDDAARHAALMDIRACLVGVKHRLGLLLLGTLLGLLLLGTLLGRLPFRCG
jgi:hypothetical protein